MQCIGIEKQNARPYHLNKGNDKKKERKENNQLFEQQALGLLLLYAEYILNVKLKEKNE